MICHLEDYEVDKKLPHAFSTTFPEMEESKRANTQMVEFLLNTDEMPGNLTGVRIRIILPAQGCNRYIQLRTQFS